MAGNALAQVSPSADIVGVLQSTVNDQGTPDPSDDIVELTFLATNIPSVQYSDGIFGLNFVEGEEEIIDITAGNVILENAFIPLAQCDDAGLTNTTNPGTSLRITSDPTAIDPLHTFLTADFIVEGNDADRRLRFYSDPGCTNCWGLHPVGVALDPNDPTSLNLFVDPTSTSATYASRFIDDYESSLDGTRLAGAAISFVPVLGTLCGGGTFNILQLQGNIGGVFPPKQCGVEVTKTASTDVVQCPCDNERPSGDSDSDSDGDGDTDSGDGDNDSDSDSDPILNGGNCSCQGVVSDFSDSDSDSDGDGDTDSGDCDEDSDSDSHYDSDDSDSDNYIHHYGYHNDSGTAYDSDSDSNGTCFFVCPDNQKVTYTYTVTNNGADLESVTVDDNKLGFLKVYPTMPAGFTDTFTAETCIYDDTTNIVTVAGLLANSNEVCSVTAEETVTVEYILGPNSYADSDSDSDSEMPGDSGDSSYWSYWGFKWWTR